MSAHEAIVIVALKTDQPNIQRRLQLILAAAEPIDTRTEPQVFAKSFEDFSQGEQDALYGLFPTAAVHRLLGDAS
jgi:hypothetical protein